MQQTQMPRPIKELRSDCPDGLVDICWRMLQKKPAARCASAKEVKEVKEVKEEKEVKEVKEGREGREGRK